MKIRTIVAEDEPTTRAMIRSRLERIGCEIVAETDNAKEALDQFRALQPDLITLDFHMPELDGVDSLVLAERVRKENPDTVLIVISGTGFVDAENQFKSAGAFIFARKPVNFDKLARDLKFMFPELKPDALL